MKDKTTKMQATVNGELFNRFKIIVKGKGENIPAVLENLMEDFVSAEEEKFLDRKFAELLNLAHGGGGRKLDLPNVKKYYEEILKK